MNYDENKAHENSLKNNHLARLVYLLKQVQDKSSIKLKILHKPPLLR